MIWVVLVGVLAIGAVVGVVAANGRTRHVVRAERTSALKGSAANGGRVIVVLKQTNRNVSLAHGLARRRAVDSAQQAPIVSNIKRSGGSKLHALTLVNAVAAVVSSKEAHALANEQCGGGRPRSAGDRDGPADCASNQRRARGGGVPDQPEQAAGRARGAPDDALRGNREPGGRQDRRRFRRDRRDRRHERARRQPELHAGRRLARRH